MILNFFFRFKDRAIGESCISDNQCANVNANSSCDETTRLCQCKTGHLYLWKYKTCSPGKKDCTQLRAISSSH